MTPKKSEIKKPESLIATTVAIPTPEEAKVQRGIEKIIENREIAPQDAFGKLTRPQIALIKHTIAKGATDDELKLFIQVCKGANLNPFLKQVFLVPRWDSKEGKEIRAIQVSIDGFRAIAESSGTYAGNDDPIYEGESDIEISVGKDTKAVKKITVPGSAKVSVYKIVGDHRYPFTATARWSEYYPGAKMGFQWHARPYLMLGKCAEALALRKAFPKLLSGMYAQEEMDKGQEGIVEANKTATGLETLKAMINKASIKELEDFKRKIAKTTKYDEKQKVELLELVEKNLKSVIESAK